LCRVFSHQGEKHLALAGVRTSLVQKVSFGTFPRTKLTRRIKMTSSVVILIRCMNSRSLKGVATIPTPRSAAVLVHPSVVVHLNLKVSRSLIKGCPL
jgi:hypothetical protein